MVDLYYKFLIRFFFLLKKFKKHKPNYSYLEKTFLNYSFDFSKSKILVDSYFKAFDEEEYDFNMISNHYFLLAAISQKKSLENILEIGTYDGTCALFMSHCFKKANITTIDLEDNNKNFIKTYNRDSDPFLNHHKKTRDKNISMSKRINFIQKDSSSFFKSNFKNYDLIFIDGDHKDPTVSYDILNSLKFITKEGYIVIDDIIDRRGSINNNYDSHAAYYSIEKLKNDGIINFLLFPKRSIFPYNTKLMKKYVALVKKI